MGRGYVTRAGTEAGVWRGSTEPPPELKKMQIYPYIFCILNPLSFLFVPLIEKVR